jgi:hypothetical protein
MNDVCDTWSSPWAELQKTLAKTPAPTSRMQNSVPGANTWLGRARQPAAWKPVQGSAAGPVL